MSKLLLEVTECVYCGATIDHNSDWTGTPRKFCKYNRPDCLQSHSNFIKRLERLSRSKNPKILKWVRYVKKHLRKGKAEKPLNQLLKIVQRKRGELEQEMNCYW